jgi:DNA-binding response OmpR family regulator
MASLLVVEDEPHIASGLAFNLQAEGHDVDVVDTGELAVARLEEGHDRYDCVILDVMLPGMDGFSVAQSARTRGWMTPILMLTARGRAEDVLRGFEAGADDYLPKPFELAILLARIGALIRRHDWHRRTSAVRRGSEAEARLDSSETFVFGDKTVDFDAQELRVGARVYPLTLMETNLLRYLVRHEGRAVSRKKMLEDVWNVREDTDTRAIDHFIARLRKYIESEPAKPRHLLTIRGVGYKFVGTPPSRP